MLSTKSRRLRILLTAIAFVPSLPAGQLARPGEIDPTGRIYTKIVARVGENPKDLRAIEKLRIYVVTANGKRVTLSTSSSGIATTWLAPETYRIVTPDPVEWQGRLLSWDLIRRVRPASAVIELTLTNVKKPEPVKPPTR
ncbi:MAG: hypothetical protein ABI681_05205 [Gemmatimonadales bacterium]